MGRLNYMDELVFVARAFVVDDDDNQETLRIRIHERNMVSTVTYYTVTFLSSFAQHILVHVL